MKFRGYLYFALVVGTTAAVAATAGADGFLSSAFTVQTYVQKKGTLRSVLHLVARDKVDHGGLCDYVVSDLHYNSQDRVLNVTLERERCFNDGFGKSSGDIYWRIPQNLKNQNLSFCVVINNETSISLRFDEETQSFLPGEEQACGAP